MKKRVFISMILTVIALAVSRPDSRAFFWAGAAVMLMGQLIRLAASAAIVKSKTLTTRGPYAVVRNPLYLGTLVMTGGMMLAMTSVSKPLLTGLLWAGVGVSFAWIYRVTIKAEEAFLRATYGQAFEDYCRAVPAILPCCPGGFFETSAYSKEVFIKNKEWRGLSGLAAILVILYLKLHYGY
ncbi:MAG: methyltransferase family protein [Elusimicrobiales bacterium]